jgi:hypothetical protein
MDKSQVPENRFMKLITNRKFANCFGCSVIMLACIVFLVIGISTCGESGTKTEKIDCDEAYIVAQAFMEQNLISPGSADFATWPTACAQQPDSSFVIISYVDSQNMFGALIRTHFRCQVRHLSGDWSIISNWQLLDIGTW